MTDINISATTPSVDTSVDETHSSPESGLLDRFPRFSGIDLVFAAIAVIVVFSGLSKLLDNFGIMELMIAGGLVMIALSAFLGKHMGDRYSSRLMWVGITVFALGAATWLIGKTGITQFIKDWWTGTVPTDGTGPAPETNITDTIVFWDLPPWVLALMAIGTLAIVGVTFLALFGKADDTTARLRRVVMTIVGVVALIGITYLLMPMINADWSTFVMPSPEEFSLEKIWELVEENLLVGGLLLAVGALVLTFFFGAVQNMLDPGEGGKRMVQITTGLAFAGLVMFVLISLLFEKDEIKSIRDGVAERVVTAVTIDDQAEVWEYWPERPLHLIPGGTITKWLRPGEKFEVVSPAGYCPVFHQGSILRLTPDGGGHWEGTLLPGRGAEALIQISTMLSGTMEIVGGVTVFCP